MIPRFEKVSAVGRGSWLVWLMVPIENEPVWDAGRGVYTNEEMKCKCVMNSADQGTRETHDGH